MPDQRGNFGLRSIHNCIIATGGRDFIMFGDAGYCNGRLTPPPKDGPRDCTFVPFVRQNRAKMPKRMAPQLASTGRLPTIDGTEGVPIALRHAVRRRWEKTAAAKTKVQPDVQPGARRSPSAPELLPVDADAERELAEYEQALLAKRFPCETFPVPKYRTFSQREPLTALDGRGEKLIEPEVKAPKLVAPPVEKYRYYSCPAQQNSCTFDPDHHDHGLAASKKTWVFRKNDGRRS